MVAIHFESTEPGDRPPPRPVAEGIPAYQPIVSLATDQLVGFEALLRWKRRDGGISPPGDFIPLAEEMGLLNRVGTSSLREACRQLSAWRAEFPPASGFGMTVNVSSRQLMQTDFVDQVASAIRDVELSPDGLQLEITETPLMENPEAAAKAFGRLLKMGVRLYLDDFGTGYSSLSYLHRFPMNKIKIDRSFISSLTARQKHPAIVESIIALARGLGTGVIAEGVETREQANQLLVMECGYAQGFYFPSRLLPRQNASWFQGRPSQAMGCARPSESTCIERLLSSFSSLKFFKFQVSSLKARVSRPTRP